MQIIALFLNNTEPKLKCAFYSGERVAELFEELPDAIDYPDYYEEIQNPIALDGIKQKIDSESYKSLDDFVADFYLMFDNARTYNAEGSSVYADAEELNVGLIYERRAAIFLYFY